MAELQDMTIERQARRVTVAFRDELYANDLLPSFMEHASRWRHVLAELQHCTFGYRRNGTQPESWDDECNTAAAFLEHRRVWLSVMTELLLLRLTPSLGAAFLDHRRVWLGVMTELQRYPVTPSHDHISITASTPTYAGAAPTTLQHATKYDATSRSPKSFDGVQ